MNNIVFSSEIIDARTIIDRRHLFLEIEYNQASLALAQEAAIEFSRWVRSIHTIQFFTTWSLNERLIKEANLEEAIQNSVKWILLSMDGWRISQNCPNVHAVKQRKKTLFLDASLPFSSFFSIDYPKYFHNSILPFIDDDEALKRAIIQLFSEEDRYDLGYWNGPDVSIIFTGGTNDRKRDNSYFGSILYSIPLFYCGNSLDEIALALGQELDQLCDLLVFANGRVGIRPWTTAAHWSPYMDYFGNLNGREDGSHLSMGVHPNEWYQVYYLCGTEWKNRISSLALTHLNRNHLEEKGFKYEIISNGSGSITVTHRKPISKIGVLDLSDMKGFLYSALYPGQKTIDIRRYLGSDINYNMLPRSDWSVIPVNAEEVKVENGLIKFEHV